LASMAKYSISDLRRGGTVGRNKDHPGFILAKSLNRGLVPEDRLARLHDQLDPGVHVLHGLLLHSITKFSREEKRNNRFELFSRTSLHIPSLWVTVLPSDPSVLIPEHAQSTQTKMVDPPVLRTGTIEKGIGVKKILPMITAISKKATGGAAAEEDRTRPSPFVSRPPSRAGSRYHWYPLRLVANVPTS